MNPKKELDHVSKELVKIEKLIEKSEDDGVYDDSLYNELNKLENRRQELKEIIDNMDSVE